MSTLKQLQSKIKFLETEISEGVNKIEFNKLLLIKRFQKLEVNLFLTEMLAGGFTLGYLLAPRSDGANNKRRFAGVILFFQVKKWVNRFKVLWRKTQYALNKKNI